MAPVKFGLFKARSRDYQEQPSTENLLHTSYSADHVATPDSPIPSTSKGIVEDRGSADLSMLSLDDDEDIISEKLTPTRRISDCSGRDEPPKDNSPNTAISVSDEEAASEARAAAAVDDAADDAARPDADADDASTTYDANSIQFDETSIAASEDVSVYCGTTKKPKRNRLKEEKQLRDFDMWRASNIEVMQNLLSRSGTIDEQIKWEAIATARGLCTLTESCTCRDCRGAKYLAGIADGDGGIGAAPFIGAGIACTVQ